MTDMITESYNHFVATQETLRQLVNLCAELQSDLAALRAQVAVLTATVIQQENEVGNLYEGVDQLTALRDALNAVFTLEAPADTCPQCHGTGLWKDNLGQGHFCWACKGKVQS
jgi:hypothetical protein